MASPIGYASLEASGLSTGFSEVVLDNLMIGKTYSTNETVNLPLLVVNTGAEAVDLKIEVIMAEPSELKAGYEAMPDLSWIKLEKADFKEILPNEAAKTDVIISIPNDKRYSGKKYQVFIWTYTVGRKVGVGLKSKLLFSIKDEI